jgi:hypothetical protein
MDELELTKLQCNVVLTDDDVWNAKYEASRCDRTEDVSAALEPVVASRMQAVGSENYQAPEPEEGFSSMDSDDIAPRQPSKVNVEHKVRIIDKISEDEDEDDADIFAALEQACVDLGYTEDGIADMLRPGVDYTDELLDWIMNITGCTDLKKIRAVLNKQKPALLVCIEALIELRKKEQTEEEAKIQEKLKKIGLVISCVPPVSRALPSFRSWRHYFVVK